MSQFPLTIEEAAKGLRSGEVTSMQLTEACLEKIYATQDTLAAFVTVTEQVALEAARKADAEFAQGIDRGPLQGIPVAVKDILATSDAPTTANSRVLDPTWGDREDATTVRKLRQTGSVLMGKLGLHEFAIGWPDPATGFRIPRNPWNLACTPGGSSSGTGTAIAAGLILGGLGTDTGGSIRGPAAFCGITGIKPTFGRVSKEGCLPLGYSLDNIGPMTRTVRDCALMLEAIAGYDPADPCSVNLPVPSMTANLTGSLIGMRIGVPKDYFFTVPELDAEVKVAVLAAIEQMAAAGAEVVEVAIPHAQEAMPAQRVTMFSEAYAYHEANLKRCPELYGQYTSSMLRLGAFFTSSDFVQAQRLRSLLRQECAAALAEVDVLVTPTMLTVAPTFAGYAPESILLNPSFMSIWNMVGFPALSISCGFSESGLPIGMQIIGNPFDEPTVFRIGDAYQQITDWHLASPELKQEMITV